MNFSFPRKKEKEKLGQFQPIDSRVSVKAERG
jgi:hypothetical protein